MSRYADQVNLDRGFFNRARRAPAAAGSACVQTSQKVREEHIWKLRSRRVQSRRPQRRKATELEVPLRVSVPKAACHRAGRAERVSSLTALAGHERHGNDGTRSAAIASALVQADWVRSNLSASSGVGRGGRRVVFAGADWRSRHRCCFLRMATALVSRLARRRAPRGSATSCSQLCSTRTWSRDR